MVFEVNRIHSAHGDKKMENVPSHGVSIQVGKKSTRSFFECHFCMTFGIKRPFFTPCLALHGSGQCKDDGGVLVKVQIPAKPSWT